MADTRGRARTSTRSLWKGAITFGPVHIPIGLYSATEETDVDFDWLDPRTLDPMGYKRINKRTGREIDKDNIVKGVEHGKGNYVVLSPEEIAEALSSPWSARELRDNYHDAIMKLVEAKAGETATVKPLGEAPESQGADVIDLTDLLGRSLKGSARAAVPAASSGKETSAKAATHHARTSRSRKQASERAVAAAAPRKRSSSAAGNSGSVRPARAKRAA